MTRPRLYLNRDADVDWLVALEFGRVDDGQSDDDWRMVSEAFGFLHAGPGGREVGFKIVELAAFDTEDDELSDVWDGPRFDVPALGLADVTVGEIVLATRALLGEASTLNRQIFGAAIHADGDEAVGLWFACLQAGDGMAHFGLGYTLYEQGRRPEAYRHLRHYTELAPQGPWPWCWLGKAALAVGEVEEARAAFERALQLEDEQGEETDAGELLAAL